MNIFNKIIISVVKSDLARSAIRNKYFNHWEKIAKKYASSRNTKAKPKLMWGSVPILNNKYWSNAMKEAGYDSTTVMREFYPSVSKRSDFDLYFEDILKTKYPSVPGVIKGFYPEYLYMDYILKNFDIVHLSCDTLTTICTKAEELALFKKFGIRTVVIPYGSDAYSYSKLLNVSRKHAIQISYPDAARMEKEIEENLNACVRQADIFIANAMVDGIGRWDLIPSSSLTVDTVNIKAKEKYSTANGVTNEVVIAHAPNHRGAKGTDFVIRAVEDLQKEGIKVRLKLIEKTSNEELLRILREEADIVVNELIGSFYGLFCIEALASGLPIITNLSTEDYTLVFRRFSYFNECPLVSGTAENVKEVLKLLIANPELRKEIGEAGRKYAEKYHSQRTAQFIFENIYEKIWFKTKEVDLMNLFHPLKKESYNNQSPLITHPLINNCIPEKFKN